MNKDYISQLYRDGGLTNIGVLRAVSMGWITTDDAVEILGEDNSLAVIRSAKIQEISDACGAMIVAGVDIEIGGRTDHFDLKLEDQSNINNLFRVVELGGTEFPYQADDGTCMIYSAADIIKIYMAAQGHITMHTAYHNALKSYILSLEDAEAISAVQYGMELPGEYAEALEEKLSVANAQIRAIIDRMTEAMS